MLFVQAHTRSIHRDIGQVRHESCNREIRESPCDYGFKFLQSLKLQSLALGVAPLHWFALPSALLAWIRWHHAGRMSQTPKMRKRPRMQADADPRRAMGGLAARILDGAIPWANSLGHFVSADRARSACGYRMPPPPAWRPGSSIDLGPQAPPWAKFDSHPRDRTMTPQRAQLAQAGAGPRG